MPLTPPRFVIREPLRASVANSLPTSLKIGTRPTYYKSLIIRLLSGTLDFDCSKTGITTNSRSDYSALGIRVNGGAFKKTIRAAIGGNFERYDRQTRRTVSYNSSLYRDIFFEFCGYFHARSQENDLQGFVHLYRILERVSFCLPLLWAARAPDYQKSFDALKKYFADPKTGELKVLERFIEDFVDQSERQTNATFNFASAHSIWKERYYTTLFGLVKDSPYFDSATAYDQIVVHFEGVFDIMITCRNRYFHALTGKAQFFNIEQMPDADEFFGILNENFANWLAFLLFKVFENELERI